MFLGTYGRKISYNLHHIFQQLYASDKKSVESVIYFLEVIVHVPCAVGEIFVTKESIIEPLVKFLANKTFVVYTVLLLVVEITFLQNNSSKML